MRVYYFSLSFVSPINCFAILKILIFLSVPLIVKFPLLNSRSSGFTSRMSDAFALDFSIILFVLAKIAPPAEYEEREPPVPPPWIKDLSFLEKN